MTPQVKPPAKATTAPGPVKEPEELVEEEQAEAPVTPPPAVVETAEEALPATTVEVVVVGEGTLKYNGSRYSSGDVIEDMDMKTAMWLLEAGIVTEVS